MRISELDVTLRSELHPGDIVSEKVDGGYKIKVWWNQKFVTEDDVIFDGDDELIINGGVFFIKRKE